MDKHTATEQAYKRGYEDGKQDALKWIPVTERLPEHTEFDWVLVIVELHSRYGIFHSVPIVAELRRGEWYDSNDETIEGEFEKVTHWMPLPQPPKEG